LPALDISVLGPVANDEGADGRGIHALLGLDAMRGDVDGVDDGGDAAVELDDGEASVNAGIDSEGSS
jgi:hypothetical protein